MSIFSCVDTNLKIFLNNTDNVCEPRASSEQTSFAIFLSSFFFDYHYESKLSVLILIIYIIKINKNKQQQQTNQLKKGSEKSLKNLHD